MRHGTRHVSIDGMNNKQMEATMETIRLYNVVGFARKSGTDDHGSEWLEFEVDGFAEQEPGMCSICGAEIESGWMCLDDGQEVCDQHVEYTEEAK
jgi:hypothetical protein